MAVQHTQLFNPVSSPLSQQGASSIGNAHPYFSHPLYNLVNQLGRQTKINVNGYVEFNRPLIQQILPYREQALPYLYQYLSTVQHMPGFIEAVYTAEELAESGTQNVASLYPAISKWNTNPDPLVQIYLAGLYRELKIPTTFGPMMATLINQSVNRYPLQSSPMYNITEEVGGTVLQQIADRTADAVIQQLKGFVAGQASNRSQVSQPSLRPQKQWTI